MTAHTHQRSPQPACTVHCVNHRVVPTPSKAGLGIFPRYMRRAKSILAYICNGVLCSQTADLARHSIKPVAHLAGSSNKLLPLGADRP